MKVPDRVVILGNKEAAIMAANKLAHRTKKKEIELILVGREKKTEFSDSNIFVPTSLVDHQNLDKSINSQLNMRVEFIDDEVVNVNLKDSSLNTKNGKLIRYDYLIVTDALELNHSAIQGYSEDARSLDSIQESLRLRDDLRNFRNGEIVIYQDDKTIFSPITGINATILIADYFKNKELDKPVNVSYVTSSKMITNNEELDKKIMEILKLKNVKVTFNFKLDLLNVKNKELHSKDDKSIKYDIPIILSPGKFTEYIEKSSFPKSDTNPIEIDFKTLSLKGFSNVFLTSLEPKLITNFWHLNYQEVDYITAKLAHKISGYPEPQMYKSFYSDDLLCGSEKAINFSIDENGQLNLGRESKSDYLLKLYAYASYFGRYSMGFL
jgi:NADH dehydrogenase FAD-containing subunit